MAFEKISRFETSSKPRDSQGSPVEASTPVFKSGSPNPHTGPGNESPQVRAFLDGLHGYLEQLIKLDVPPEYLKATRKVLAEQASVALGEQITPDKLDTVLGGEKVAPAKTETIQGGPCTCDAPGEVKGSGKAPTGMPPDLWDYCVTAGKKTGVDPYILAAQMEKESQYGKLLAGSPSGGDGLMQIEPSTRAAYASKFQAKMGHAYNHASKQDQVALAAVILADKGGSATNMLQKYNGGDNWKPGTCDSYGREIQAGAYARIVVAHAEAMKKGAV